MPFIAFVAKSGYLDILIAGDGFVYVMSVILLMRKNCLIISPRASYKLPSCVIHRQVMRHHIISSISSLSRLVFRFLSLILELCFTIRLSLRLVWLLASILSAIRATRGARPRQLSQILRLHAHFINLVQLNRNELYGLNPVKSCVSLCLCPFFDNVMKNYLMSPIV